MDIKSIFVIVNYLHIMLKYYKARKLVRLNQIRKLALSQLQLDFYIIYAIVNPKLMNMVYYRFSNDC